MRNAVGKRIYLVELKPGDFNLGRIARISVNTPFNPPAHNILYQDGFLMHNLLLREQTLSKESIAAKSKALLGKILGKPVNELE